MIRSFVIPVLDMSPHSDYNITTLLDDLADIEGEVVCVFNAEDMFDKLRDHPRITRYAFCNQNIGVSRAWNVGINMSEGDAVFVLNADLHITAAAVQQMHDYLFSLDKAAIVGPQGSLIDFANLKLLKYYKTGKFDEPVATDDVSGFLFAINRHVFVEHGLQFDPRYSPCFMEEWDLGMQLRARGLKGYAVPVSGYDHQWGVSQSKDGSKPIHYMGTSVTRGEIIPRNRKAFINKWFGADAKS